jgi:molybdopterin converting factor small subunit
LVGAGELEIELPVTATVQTLRQRLADQYPELSRLLDRCAVAINEEYASQDAAIPAEAAVAIIPPISGG